jgi:uncharacterized membrane protein
MSLESNKNLGGVGAILILIAPFLIFVPLLSGYLPGVLGLVGFILVMIALYRLSHYYNEGGIFRNAIWGVVTGIVGVVVTVVVAVVAVLVSLVSLENFVLQFYPGWKLGDWASLSGMTPIVPNSIDYSALASLIVAVVAVIVVLIVFTVISAYFFRRSLKQLSTKSMVGLFSTAGIFLLVGAILLIVLIGAILIWISILLLAIAFFQLKSMSQQPTMVTAAPPQQPPTPV